MKSSPAKHISILRLAVVLEVSTGVKGGEDPSASKPFTAPSAINQALCPVSAANIYEIFISHSLLLSTYPNHCI